MHKNINVVEEFLKAVGAIAIILSIVGIIWGVFILLGIL